jgi:dTDP-4-amino-4,6-dideoxygalactose transaminase
MAAVTDRPIPVLDLTRYDAELKAEISRGVAEVFATGRFVMGAAVEAFETDFAAAMQVRHAIGVSSGTDALLVALMAMGIQPGDEVITSPFTFFASAGTVARLNATPVFVDIEPEGFNLDPAKLEAAITSRTKVIQPVHLYGQCADMDAIGEIARRRGIPILEDACQAVGATLGGRPAGGLGTAAAFSFYPTKNLGAAGDAGAVTTDDDDLAARIKSLRIHGSTVTYHHDHVGGNFRIDALQAVVLRAKLPRLAGWNERRRAVAARYGERLAEAAKAGKVTLPKELPGRRHVYHQYVVRLPKRDAVKAKLAETGIGSSVFYPVPLNEQNCFAHLGGKGKCPVASKAAAEVLALPIYPELTDAEIDRVAEALTRAL